MGISFWKSLAFFALMICFSVAIYPSQRQLGMFLSHSKDFDEALHHLERRFYQNPEDLFNTQRYLKTLLNAGVYPVLELIGKKVIDYHPDEISLHEIMAEYYRGSMQYDKARVHWEKIIDLDSSRKDIRETLYSYYLLNKKEEELIVLQKKALSLEASRVEDLRELARLYSLRKDVRNAISIYQLWIRAYPYDVEPKMKLADIYAWAGLQDKVVEIYQTVTELVPNNPKYALELVHYLYKYEKDDLAIRWLEKNITNYSDEQQLYDYLVEFYLRQDQVENAIAVLKKMESQFGSRLEHLNKLANVYFVRKDYAAAQQYAERYHQKTTGDYRSRRLLGDIYDRLAKKDLARKQYELALADLRS